MAYKLIFKLTRPARSKGGDRYEATLKGKEGPVVIYIPQEISRPTLNVPTEKFEVFFEPK